MPDKEEGTPLPIPDDKDPNPAPVVTVPPKTEAPKKEDKKDSDDEDDWVLKLNATDDQKKFIKKTTKEAITRKERIAELEAELNERKKKEADEQRRRDEETGNWKKIAEEAEQKLKAKDQRIIKSELRSIAIKENMIDLDDVNRIDFDDVKLNDDGELINGEKLIKKLKADKPHWFKVDGDEPKGTTSGDKKPPAPSKETGTPKSAMDMTDEEFREAEKKMRSKK